VRYAFTKEKTTCYVFVNVRLKGFWSLLGQSKFESLTVFRDVNHEGVDTMLVMVAH
jgi:hypothetical protein